MHWKSGVLLMMENVFSIRTHQVLSLICKLKLIVESIVFILFKVCSINVFWNKQIKFPKNNHVIRIFPSRLDARDRWVKSLIFSHWKNNPINRLIAIDPSGAYAQEYWWLEYLNWILVACFKSTFLLCFLQSIWVYVFSILFRENLGCPCHNPGSFHSSK